MLDQHDSAVVFWINAWSLHILHNTNILFSCIFFKWSHIEEVWVFTMLWAFLFLTRSRSLASSWEREGPSLLGSPLKVLVTEFMSIHALEALMHMLEGVLSFGCHWIKRCKWHWDWITTSQYYSSMLVLSNIMWYARPNTTGSHATYHIWHRLAHGHIV